MRYTFALLSVFAGAASGEEGSCDSNGSPIRQAAAYVQSFDSYTLTYVHLFNIFHVHEASFCTVITKDLLQHAIRPLYSHTTK